MRCRIALDLEGGPVTYEELSGLAHHLVDAAVCVSALPGGRRVWVTIEDDGEPPEVVDHAARRVIDTLFVVSAARSWAVVGTQVLAIPERVAG